MEVSLLDLHQLPTSRTSLPSSDRGLRLPSCSAFSPRISLPFRLRWTDGGTIVWDGASVQEKFIHPLKSESRQSHSSIPLASPLHPPTHHSQLQTHARRRPGWQLPRQGQGPRYRTAAVRRPASKALDNGPCRCSAAWPCCR